MFQLFSYLVITAFLVFFSMNTTYFMVHKKVDFIDCVKKFFIIEKPPQGRSIFDLFLCDKDYKSGPASLAFVINQLPYPYKELKEISKLCGTTSKGTTIQGIKNAAEILGLTAISVKEDIESLCKEIMPVIAYINDKNYVVIEKKNKKVLYIFDPVSGHIIMRNEQFMNIWNGNIIKITTKPIPEN